MRVINLDTIGIKLISSKRKQIYLTKDEIKLLLTKDYEIKNNTLYINNKKLPISDIDLEDFDNILTYIQANFS